MRTNQRQVLRAALRLHDALQVRAAREAETALNNSLSGFQHNLEQFRAKLRPQGRCGASLTSFSLRRHLLRLGQSVRHAGDDMLQAWPVLHASAPNLRDVLAELQQLDAEFEEVHLDLASNTLAVTTEPIELEEIYLGPFAIRLAWRRLAQGDADLGFTVVALDPQPAASDDTVTHPHVKKEMLCAGEAKVPLHRAVSQGRLADAFFLIRGVLTHYNASSPYVPLDAWLGQGCDNCSAMIPSDDLWYCGQCGHDFCSDCTGRCALCDEVRCHNCLTSCSRCSSDVCPGCLAATTSEEPECCRDCHEAAVAAKAKLNPSVPSSATLSPPDASCLELPGVPA